MDFYNNEKNEPLKFKLNIEGINENNIETRLILTSEKENYLFYGKINENMCIFDVPELKLYKKGSEGKIKFEIISEDLYFNVWEDDFNINSKASITFEQLVDNTKKSTPDKPKISAIFEKTEEKKPIIKENKIELKEKENNENGIKKFDKFF